MDKKLSTRIKLRTLAAIADAIAVIHEAGMVHGNLKPQNVLFDAPFTEAPTPLVCDFGFARMVRITAGRAELKELPTSSGETFNFMAPEHVTSLVMNSSSDVFSLCLMIWSALSGELPFAGLRSLAHYKSAVCDAGLRPDLSRLPSDVPAAVHDLLVRGWDCDPARRPPAEAVAAVLRQDSESIPEEAGIVDVVSALCGTTTKLAADELERRFSQSSTTDEELAAALAAGAVPRLVAALRRGVAAASTAAALYRLCSSGPYDTAQTTKRLAVDEGAVPVLARLLSSTNHVEVKAAAEALHSISQGSRTCKAACVSADAVPALLSLLLSAKSDESNTAAEALGNIAAGDSTCQHAVIPELVSLLSSSKGYEAERAAGALGNMSAFSATIKAACVTAGAVPRLLSLLQSKHGEESKQAAWALWNIAWGDTACSASTDRRGATTARSVELSWRRAEESSASLEYAAATEAECKAAVIPELVLLLSSGTIIQAEWAAGALRNITAGDSATAAACVSAGVVPALRTAATRGVPNASWALSHLIS